MPILYRVVSQKAICASLQRGYQTPDEKSKGNNWFYVKKRMNKNKLKIKSHFKKIDSFQNFKVF